MCNEYKENLHKDMWLPFLEGIKSKMEKGFPWKSCHCLTRIQKRACKLKKNTYLSFRPG